MLPSDLLHLPALARLLGVHDGQLYHMVERGDFPIVSVGTRPFVRLSDLVGKSIYRPITAAEIAAMDPADCLWLPGEQEKDWVDVNEASEISGHSCAALNRRRLQGLLTVKGTGSGVRFLFLRSEIEKLPPAAKAGRPKKEVTT